MSLNGRLCNYIHSRVAFSSISFITKPLQFILQVTLTNPCFFIPMNLDVFCSFLTSFMMFPSTHISFHSLQFIFRNIFHFFRMSYQSLVFSLISLSPFHSPSSSSSSSFSTSPSFFMLPFYSSSFALISPLRPPLLPSFHQHS